MRGGWSAMPISNRGTKAASLALLLVATHVLASDAPVVLSRAEWGARPPASAMIPHTPRRLTIHQTATRANAARSLPEKLRSLQRFSQSNAPLADGRLKVAWADIPYHFYIDVHGDIGEGRAVPFVGDTNTTYHPGGHIGIVLEGNFEDAPPAPQQIEALVGLLVHLARRYDIAPEAIEGHRHYARTLCPGARLNALLPDIRRDVARALRE